ncbi:MAG: hypothetical protein LBV37_01735 [Mycoplasmataceae bacterium]|jgi:hypothetical protein|nr:hypothetical protein [Mycoplasmataceae bacterium]
MKKVKVLDAKINKKLIGDELKLESIGGKKPPVIIDKKHRKPKTHKMTVQDLADLILPRLDLIETTLKEHTAIFERNNLH